MANMYMGMDIKMSQQLVMTPQLQQAIKLLQLSTVELEEFIDQALIENPTLEKIEDVPEDVVEPEFAEEQTDFLAEQEQSSYDDEWQEYIESGAGTIRESRNQESSSDHLNTLEAVVASHVSLQDHIWQQLDSSKLSPVEKKIATLICGHIDDDGYLSVSIRDMISSLEELFKLAQELLEQKQQIKDTVLIPEFEGSFNLYHESYEQTSSAKKKNKKEQPTFVQEEEEEQEQEQNKEQVPLYIVGDELCAVVETVLRKMQEFSPSGFASRSLVECLLLQIMQHKPVSVLTYNIVAKHLSLLEQRNFKRIAYLEKATIPKVTESYNFIISLEPKPGRPFYAKTDQYVTPDVYIYKRGSEYVVSLNQNHIPQLKINSYYKQLLEKTKDKTNANEDEEMAALYIQEKIKSGDWLIKSIEQRQKTIFRVAESILKHQYEFFEKGIAYLTPMVLKDIAKDINVHESTVSRITTNKYIHTPQGLFELKYFFTSGLEQQDGQFISSQLVKNLIKNLLDSENINKPYTDLQIKNILEKQENIKVARRTVAKYREALNILPSNKRKKLF